MTWQTEGTSTMAGWLSVGVRTGLIPFIVLYAALYASFGMVSPFLPVLLERRELNPNQIGLILALSTAVRLVSGPSAGRIADAFNALRAVFACCALAAAAIALGFLGSGDFMATLLVSLLYAALLAPLTTTADALALAAAGPADQVGRRFEYGWVRGCGSAAFIVGSLLAGRIIVTVDLDAIIWGGSLFLAAAAAAVTGVSARRTSTTRSLGAPPSLWALLRLPQFNLILIIAALVLGSHAMHDAFAMIRWRAAGITPPTASLLWSESVAAEVLVFIAAGPWLLHRIAASTAMAIAAAAGAVRWAIFAMTADVAAMALAEPLHGLSFALLHLACMRLIGQLVPSGLAATAQAIYGTVAIGAVTSLLTLASGGLYSQFGAAGFWAMAALSIMAMPFIVKLRRAAGGEAPLFPANDDDAGARSRSQNRSGGPSLRRGRRYMPRRSE
jgi:MFS transporter, PPP family, 3-phenylpropionic acid transporter